MLVKLMRNFFDNELYRVTPGGTLFPDDYPREKLPKDAKVLDSPEAVKADRQEPTALSDFGRPASKETNFARKTGKIDV
jgi:hypothetical protein